ncbi:hypothetical protein [Chryseobacterium artocarpi]|uniref:hypothetical protein n=1 Tax=Chryseobacterium artocarpi TaxID=1414727 RepID=UPI003F418995
MKINPIIIFNILIVIFLLIAIAVTVFMVKNGMNIYYISASAFTSLLLLFILYSINKGIPSSHQVISTIEKNKERLDFNDKELIINSPVMEHKQIIEWNNVEAIYCLNMIPLDGTYHNFEYSIFLKQPAKTEKYKDLSWYNKLVSSENNSLELKINDYDNIDFKKFHPAVEKYLIKKETSEGYLHKKFGNNTRSVQENNTTTSFPADQPLKTFELYKIFDKEDPTNDEKLKEYRANAIKI